MVANPLKQATHDVFLWNQCEIVIVCGHSSNELKAKGVLTSDRYIEWGSGFERNYFWVLKTTRGLSRKVYTTNFDLGDVRVSFDRPRALFNRSGASTGFKSTINVSRKKEIVLECGLHSRTTKLATLSLNLGVVEFVWVPAGWYYVEFLPVAGIEEHHPIEITVKLSHS